MTKARTPQDGDTVKLKPGSAGHAYVLHSAELGVCDPATADGLWTVEATDAETGRLYLDEVPGDPATAYLPFDPADLTVVERPVR